VPERHDSDEKPRRRLSDPKVIDLEKKREAITGTCSSCKKRNFAFDLKPLPDKFNFVDKIKAPYEVSKPA